MDRRRATGANPVEFVPEIDRFSTTGAGFDLVENV